MMLPYALLQVLHCISAFKWQIVQLQVASYINTLNTTSYTSPEMQTEHKVVHA